MDVIAAYRDLGSYRGAAAICGMTPRTVKRIIDAAEVGTLPERAERAHNYDEFSELVAQRIEATKGRISAKRLLPAARAAGYSGSARNLRRLVAEAKVTWHAEHHRVFRPAVWAPGDVLAIDWGAEGRLHVFCAVLAWSRVRFIAFADNERQETTLALLAQCFEAIGGVPQVVLADRMGCLKGGVVANVVVPAPGYVAFASHYGFRPDFCEAADPQSKGIVENLVGYAKSDVIAVGEVHAGDIAAANVAASAWCDEVNHTKHSEIAAIPAERLVTEQSLLRPLPSLRPSLAKRVTRKVDALSTVRFGSARYSVPTRHVGRQVQLEISGTNVSIIDLGEVIATHAIVAPGESSITDEHYGGPRPDRRRAVRPRTEAEKTFCALGPVAEAFIKGAAARGVTMLAADLGELAMLLEAHGEAAFIPALERAVHFRRFRATDVASILAAGTGVQQITPVGDALIIELPHVPLRPLSAYATSELS
jgi:transposase